MNGPESNEVAMKGHSKFSQVFRWFSVIIRMLIWVGVSYLSAQMQLAYSTDPVNWDENYMACID